MLRPTQPLPPVGGQLLHIFLQLPQPLTVLDRVTYLVGTVHPNLTQFPQVLKDVKAFERHGQRDDVRYLWNNFLLYVQGLDKRSVSLLTMLHAATAADLERKVKVDGKWQLAVLQLPEALQSYKRFMGS